MRAELIRTFRFEAAHRLDGAPAGHKCRRLHGHNYRVDVHVAGDVDAETGWVMDFGQIDAAVQPVIDQLDHRCLNDIDRLERATSEVLAGWLWEQIAPRLPGLTAVTVWETDTARCVYRGP